MKKNKTFINGSWVDGTSGKTLQSVNPATGEQHGRCRNGDSGGKRIVLCYQNLERYGYTEPKRHLA